MEYFNFDEYIWQIQFLPQQIVPKREHDCITVDYINRLLIVQKTDIYANQTQEVKIKIDDARFEDLLKISKIEKIREFETLSEPKLKKLEKGYRDGWGLVYCYFSNDAPPKKEGILRKIYEGNPIEEIAYWIMRSFPNEHIAL